MTDVVIQLNELSAIWGQQMWRASWQGGIALLLVFLVGRAVRNMPVELTCWLWRLAFLKFLIAGVCIAPLLIAVPLPFETGMPSPLPEASDETHERTAALPDHSVLESHREFPSPLPNYSPTTTDPQLSRLSWLFIAWGVGMVLCITHFLKQCLQIRRIISTLPKVDDESVLQRVVEACRQMGVKRVPAVRVTNDASSPLLFGFVHPTIVLPSLVLGSASDEKLNVAIAHELAHVKRRDLLWNWLPALTRLAFFFHPLVWLAQREWRLVQESATDKLAIASSRLTNEQYAMTLLELISKCTAPTRIPPVAIAVSDAYSQLSRRIVAMQRFQNVVSRRVLVVSATVLFLGALGLLPWAMSSREPGLNSSAAADDKNALKQFEKDYALGEKEVIKRIPPPYSAGRLAYYRANMSKQQVEAMPDGPSVFIFHWRDNKLHLKSGFFANPDLSFPLKGLLPMLCQIPPERIYGDRALIEQYVSGDFIVRNNAPSEDLVTALQPILDTELKSRVLLNLDESEVEVYVARGTFKLSNEVKSNQNVLVIESSGYQTAKSIEEAVRPGLAPRFDFQRTLEEIGKSIGVPVVSEIASPPTEKILCVAIRQIPINELNTRTFNLKAALDSLTAQTGLTFTKEKRKILTLNVKAAGALAPPRQQVSSVQAEANEANSSTEDANSFDPTDTSDPSFESPLAPVVKQFGPEYSLGEKEVIKRIAPPYTAARNAYFQRERGGLPTFTVLRWHANLLKDMTNAYGGNLRSVLAHVCQIGPERIRGDRQLMQLDIEGDFLFRSDAPREEIVAALQPILITAVTSPIKLKLEETEEDVYVASGTFELNDIVKNRGNVVVIESKNTETGESIESGYSRKSDFNGFLDFFATFADAPIVNEVKSLPNEKIHFVAVRQTKDVTRFDLQSALDDLSTQTGLTFTKEKRKILTLTVAEKD
ncbi:MAG: M56 family metallopeptidase [Planctomycetaceae bacterium]